MLRKDKSVLVVDDDEDVLIVLEWALENEGYSTTTAWSGQEGLNLLRSKRFDLVLVDEHLPDLGWRAILGELRRKGVKTPVMIMQATAPKSDEVDQYASSGICGWVRKQMPREVTEAVDKCFESSASTRVCA